MTVPRVTIGMPVFNDIEFIEESIESLLNQSYENFKLILSDDGSTDGSSDICLKYAEIDDRIEYIRQPKNLGISRNMEFLARESDTEYFMWAGDDDIWHKEFLEKCVSLLELNKDAVVAFSKYDTITEAKKKLRTISKPAYSNASSFVRLKEFIRDADDGFGYGLLRTEVAQKVSFPVWWWPNRKTPYNNIYPTLCFYLAQGNYKEYSEESLFYKRVKTEGRVNHKLIGEGNAFYETIAYVLRRFNLTVFSFREIRRAKNIGLAFRIFPLLIYNWFLLSSLQQINLAAKSFVKNRVLKN
ncbi:Glycosyltransferase involved in cell wall bisynthesis [Lishizhenia tianjinensis]|uniref:Glycosyltransferase involved in cell wall bisynthesis n=1 Tax=Lishizhenia tianjinensis TaxID=477690 RepID=A0A1I6ZV58_9FLAO|nr:glycosyltransferase family 2 protein [Lishizhenia tianjinensis]SFT66562.1 Glycosyltransferase involved in cell wall bisynthesis [Lishizhenia tianjinensis]